MSDRSCCTHCFAEACGNYYSCSQYSDFLSWESPGVGRPLVFMLGQAVLYFLIIVYLESGVAKKLKGVAVKGTACLLGSSNDPDEVSFDFFYNGIVSDAE